MIVTPEGWYMAFWIGMLGGLYFVIKAANIASEKAIRTGEVLTPLELMTAVLLVLVIVVVLKWG